ncbi:MAG: carboxymethylenebutenolidase [Candidatus Binatia bacterium]|nr:MAG: carboxymethylenebutenolidase [Candidatus Binatia bacterium]
MKTEVRGEMVSFRGRDAELRGYAARPDAAEPLPAILLVPDVRGLYEHFRDVSRRFAAEGFFVLAVDLYSREGPPNLPDFEAVRKWIEELPDRRVLADIEDALGYLRSSDAVRSESVGITGFCMGGQYALMAACSVEGFAACVSWYGMLRYERKTEKKPESPLELARHLRCPFLGLFGAEDPLIPLSDVEELRRILAETGRPFEIHVYPGAGHAFFNDTRPDAYRPEAASDAWQKAVAFFRRHLGGR